MDSLVLGLRVLVSLAAVLGLIWVLQRRLKRRGGSTRAAGPVISVLGRQGVGHKASVVLLDADGQRLLLGVTEHGVSVLRSTPDTAAAPASTEAAFASTLSAATGSPLRAAAHRPRATPSAAPAPDLPAGTAAVTTSISEPDHGSVLLAATVPAEDPEGGPSRPRGRHAAAVPTPAGPLSGSILDLGTWRQARDAARWVAGGRRP